MSEERPVSDLLAAMSAPNHEESFWSGLDARLDSPAEEQADAAVTGLLAGLSAPDHEESFWGRLDSLLTGVVQTQVQSSVFESADASAPAEGSTVFRLDTARVAPPHGALRQPASPARPPAARSRRRPPFVNPRFLLAAALVAIVVGGSLVLASMGDDDEPSIAAPIITTTTGAPGTLPAPEINASSSVQSVQAVAASGQALASSSNGKYVYMAVPMVGADPRCGRGAVTLVAQPVEGGAAMPVLTDRVFSAPSFSAGPKGQLLVTDACDGATVVRSGDTGQLLVDRSILAAGRTFAAGSFGVSGSQVYVRDTARDEWFGYDMASTKLAKRDDVPAKTVRVAELESGELLVVREDAGKRLNVLVGSTAVGQVRSGASAADAVSVSVDGRNIAVATDDSIVVAFAGLRLARLDGKVRTLSWSPDSASLIVAPETGGLDVVTRPVRVEDLTRSPLGYQGTIDRLLPLPGQTAFMVTAGAVSSDQLAPGATARLQVGK